MPVLADSPASLLGAAALVITAIGGLVTGIIAARRQPPQIPTSSVPTSAEVWIETLHQLELVTVDRDKAVAQREAAHRSMDRWKLVAQECEAERLDLLRRLAAEE